jgi:hypothetical protein
MSEACAAFARRVAGAAVAGAVDWASTVAALVKVGAVIVFEDDADGGAHTPPREQVAQMVALGARAKVPANAGAWFDGLRHDTYSTWAVLRQIGKAFSAYKAAAIQLDLRDESKFAMAVIPWAALDDVKALARTAGGRIISRSPPRPIAKPMPAAKAPPAHVKRLHVDSFHHSSSQRGDADGMVLGLDRPRRLVHLAVTSWPPVREQLFDFHVGELAKARDGRWVASGWTSDKQRLFAWSDGTAVPLPPENIGIDEIGAFEDTVVVFPNEHVYRTGVAKQPLVLRGKKWVPLDVPDVVVRPPRHKNDMLAFVVAKTARTADRDVVLWQGGGYARNGKKLERVFDLGELHPYGEWSSVPDGDGFYLCANEKLLEVRPGESPVQRLDGHRAYRAMPGLDGAIVVSVIRAKGNEPGLLVWWPAERTYAKVPAKDVSLKGTHMFDEHGVCATSRLVWGYDSLRQDLRAVAWDYLAALPRVPEGEISPARTSPASPRSKARSKAPRRRRA